jgi:hypothetical protein
VDFFVEDDIVIPHGPEIASPGPLFQLKGASGNLYTPSTTVGNLVPEVSGEINVRVYITNTPDPTGEPTTITDAWLYWAPGKVSGGAHLLPPTAIGSYTPIRLSPTVTPNRYLSDSGMPLVERVWYFLLTKDSQGNFDRQPEMENAIDLTAFTFDPSDPCDTIPSIATSVRLDAETMEATWVLPTTNTDGSPLLDLAGVAVVHSINDGPWVVAPGGWLDADATSFTDAGMADGDKVRLLIVPYDTCAVPNYAAGAFSNIVYKGNLSTFETDFQGWSRSGLWHLSTSANVLNCAPAPAIPNASQFMYYGRDWTCDFFTGANHFGWSGSPYIWLNDSPSITFDYLLDASAACPGGPIVVPPYDNRACDTMYMCVFSNGSCVVYEELPVTGPSTISTYTRDLSAAANSYTRILFYFTALDGTPVAGFQGGLFDNVNIDP